MEIEVDGVERTTKSDSTEIERERERKKRKRERGRGGQRLYGGTTEIEAASGGKDNKRREARIEPSPANEQDTVDTRESDGDKDGRGGGGGIKGNEVKPARAMRVHTGARRGR